MAQSKKALPKARKKAKGRNTLPAVKPRDKNLAADAADAAKLFLRPTASNALVIHSFKKMGGNDSLEVVAVMNELAEQVEMVNGDDLTRAEAMLISQAHSLESMFCTLSRIAVGAELVSNVELYLKLALRAQSQCRATLETLAEIKNPTAVAFVRQANFSNGPQQVNNTPGAPSVGARAGENKTAQNKQLEVIHGERLDTTKAGASIGADSAMATVVPLDRAANA